MRYIFNLYWRIVRLLSMPVILAEYFQERTGREYGVGFFAKIGLLLKMRRNLKRIVTASALLEHLTMAAKILSIPKSMEGCVVECGCYKGGSTANLSLVSALCGRRLEVFDSFEGLPEPSERDKAHVLADKGEVHSYSKGSWQGGLQEVKGNIARCGRIDVCNFHVGYFDTSIPQFKTRCVFAFVDVDLRDSLEPCLRYLWPLLQDGCHVFTHEAPHMEIASLFFDREWWRSNLDADPPGLVGAGCGLGLDPASGGFRSDIGYTLKNPQVMNLKEVAQPGIT